MSIQEMINTLVANTEEIKKAYLTVENVRHCIYDIPYADLKAFADHIHTRLNTDANQRRAYIIHSPMIDGKMDTDIWIYSKPVTIKPAEIIEE